MSKKSKYVIQWRERTKRRIIESFDSKCGICGYSKCIEALDLHHLDPQQKEFNFGKIRANPKSWEKLVEELRKCVLLCSNCHREYHNGITHIPDDIKKFDEKHTDYLEIKKRDRKDRFLIPCPICGKEKFIYNKTCSLKCAAELKNTYNWNLYDLKDMFLVKKMSIEAIAREIECSGGAVRKRLKKEKII